MIGNVNIINHIIHFIIGAFSYNYSYITGLFLLYQLFDGFKFNYKVVRTGELTDDIPLDLLYFCLGELSVRYFIKYI